ncbi:MAG TPA: hypothetical protein VNW90_18670 [Acetobacteraceae bacterium]|nr:hypothetical protein [Acetobacteraceae bacterium]
MARLAGSLGYFARCGQADGTARAIGESLPSRNGLMMSGSRCANAGMIIAEPAGLGYRLSVKPTMPITAPHGPPRQFGPPNSTSSTRRSILRPPLEIERRPVAAPTIAP